ncbi:hypothetical protein [Paracoccus seriniphilus]|uniref:Uncharacterized protein n=1 Tax=Paracoccus seriniphilus TaxID=184748 RepID=A0A239Q3B3_9RHOB|nr:hypothetical protein [Paracoccus seriniphilus]WCR13210.1 hypothetical protein JHW44_09680 [Paracoccus seriniphilus]SNT76703.1 hypothetical protein SAMN05444959_12510 [Paracoccus seriniphilus]
MIIKVGFRGGRGPGIPDGAPGQVVGYDAQGNPAAIDPRAAGLPPGQPGQVLGYDAEGVPGPIDPPVPTHIDLGTFN